MRRALLLALLLCASGRAAAAQGTVPRDTVLLSAEHAARAWLQLLETARFDSAYAQVAGAMRAQIGRAQWSASMQSLRALLPPGAERVRLNAEHSVPLFGGASVLLSFRVGGTGWREIVVLVRDRSRWKIGGYGVLM